MSMGGWPQVSCEEAMRTLGIGPRSALATELIAALMLNNYGQPWRRTLAGV